jgi:hypothetical protein
MLDNFSVVVPQEAGHTACWKPKGMADETKSGCPIGNVGAHGPQDPGCPGPLHGYGVARRIEQISGDLLAVNQGTLYPVLLKPDFLAVSSVLLMTH